MLEIKEVVQLGSFKQLSHHIKDGDHLVHIYENSLTLIDLVADFVVPGITQGDGIIIIAAEKHKKLFIKRMENRAIDVTHAQALGQLLILDATSTLNLFMVEDKPCLQKFNHAVMPSLEKMKIKYPKIRIYGEMVNLLWHQDNIQGVIALEGFWNDLAQKHKFSFLCAYFMSKEERSTKAASFHEICCTHSHVISSEENLKKIAIPL